MAQVMRGEKELIDSAKIVHCHPIKTNQKISVLDLWIEARKHRRITKLFPDL
jgi:hypothetical protein